MCQCLYSFRQHYGPGINSVFNRNEDQEYLLGGKGGRCVGLTRFPTSCADCLEIWEPEPSGPVQGCTEIALHYLRYINNTFSSSDCMESKGWIVNVL